MRRDSRCGHALLLSLTLLCCAGLAFAEDTGPNADPDYVRAMEREHAGDHPVASPATQLAPRVAVRGSDVEYALIDGKPIRGHLAMPEGQGPFPGVIVIHEWWGLNDNIRAMARQLAGEGYAALAVDLYEGESAVDRAGATALMQNAMAQRARLDDNLRQAHAFLKVKQHAPRIGTIGWCFGGGWSLATALLMPSEIDASVIYYGRVVTDKAELAALQTPILGLFGALDQGIPVASVQAFESALQELHKPASIRIYPGADHAFANPSGTHYDAPAAEDAWRRTLEFLRRYLQP